MGWTVCSDIKTREDIVDRVRRGLQFGGQVVRRSTTIGNNFWALMDMPDGRVLIAHTILQGSQPHSPGWGYKDLSHRDGIDCPVDYLRQLHDTMDESELEWRAAVRKYHDDKVAVKKQRELLKPGRELTLYEKKYRLVQFLGTKGWSVLCLVDNKNYRMSSKQLNEALRDLRQQEQESNLAEAQRAPLRPEQVQQSLL